MRGWADGPITPEEVRRGARVPGAQVTLSNIQTKQAVSAALARPHGGVKQAFVRAFCEEERRETDKKFVFSPVGVYLTIETIYRRDDAYLRHNRVGERLGYGVVYPT